MRVETFHKILLSDSRFLDLDEGVQMVLTSPPYWRLKDYPDNPGQLGNIDSYELFLAELRKVFTNCFHALVPAGRMCVVVGDVCLARQRDGRHRLIPFHSDVIKLCMDARFDYLAPIIWYKVTNVRTEAKRRSYALGRPGGPNAVIKNDVEYILVFRKPGGYRKVDKVRAKLSQLSKTDFAEHFSQVWRIDGDRINPHPAPYPLEVAERLVKMFSYVGDVVLDPFLGSGTTTLAAIKTGRSSIGYEVEPTYFKMAKARIEKELLNNHPAYHPVEEDELTFAFKVAFKSTLDENNL